MHKKLLSVVMAIVLVVGLNPGTALAAVQAATSGDIGPQEEAGFSGAAGTWGTCNWEIDAEGNLTVRGGH